MSELSCPHCSKPLSVETVATLADQTRFAFCITPHPGQLMHAKTIGGVITQMSKVYDAIGKDLGQQVHLLVEKIGTDEDGAIRVQFMLAIQEKSP